MTLLDRVGKYLACMMRRKAFQRPGKPNLMSYDNVIRCNVFNNLWRWSWRKDGRGSYRAALAQFWRVSTSR